MSPAFTAYDKRSLYLRHNVTRLLKAGENVIAIRLGNGFFNISVSDSWNFQHAPWRNSPRLLFELFIDEKSTVASDTSWRCRTNGATSHNCIRTGEYYDARLEDGWRSVEYCDTGWDVAKIVHPAGGKIEEMTMPEVKELEELTPVARWRSENGWIYDFGKNISGYVSLACEGKRGTELKLRYAEALNGKEINQSFVSIHAGTEYPFAEDRYVFSGNGLETWRPEFVYHGFRYVEFSWNTNTIPPRNALTAHFVHTDLKKRGDFKCSGELLSWIYDAGIRAFLSNYQGMPIDCPQREKNGWTGDAVISADYALCLFDMEDSYAKWMKDIMDSQRESGQLPGIAPTGGWGFNWGSGPAWDTAMFTLPYLLYTETGITKLLDLVYEAQKKYLSYAKTREDGDGLVCYGLNDWCPATRVGELNLAPNRLSDSCVYYAMLSIAAKSAELRADSTAARTYSKRAKDVKAAIKKIYVDEADISTYGQGALAFLLYYKIVNGKEAAKIAKQLAELVTAENYVYKVGILGMKALPNALSDYGYTDVAYKYITREDYPSYSYWKKIGETTLCETWEENQSRNHHMYSDVVNWMIRNIAGLKNRGIAYDKISFEPYFFSERCSASAKTETPRGLASISWEKRSDLFTAEINVPAGAEATLTLPGGKTIPVTTGKFNIKI